MSSSRMRSALTISSRSRCSAHGLDQLGHRARTRADDEACRAQHPQRIVEERHVERRAACAGGGRRGRRGRRADRRSSSSGSAQRHRVHREVAPREVGLDVVAERDLGLAALGPVDVGPEGGDLAAGRRRGSRRRCRSACPGATGARPSRSSSPSIASGRASVARSMSLPSSSRRRRRVTQLPPTR